MRKRDLFFIIIVAFGILCALFDVAFIVYASISFLRFYRGISFIPNSFYSMVISAVTINGLAILASVSYFIFRR